MGPIQLKEVKALIVEWDSQSGRAMVAKDWHGLLDYAWCFFQALQVLFGLAHLLHHLLAMHYPLASSKILLAKVMVTG